MYAPMVGASARPRFFSLRSRSRSPGSARLVLAWRSSIRRRIAVLSLSQLKVSSTFNFLVIATGAMHSYFGHENWAAVAPGLKWIEDGYAYSPKHPVRV